MVYDDDEIRQLLKEERSRGKKRPSASQESIKRRLEQLQIVKNLLAERNFNRFLQRLNGVGLKVGSDEYKLAVGAWLDHWHGQH